ncbi:ribbon-helix-helix domain-containing protein [Azospirillum sp. SYSU D00513]|uniref:ribbon-helix-helix domain-containing protein n=1 Tax=Azospirillum sp. SYSU D00513 TaxID=2812561 RepID=UPI0032B5998E
MSLAGGPIQIRLEPSYWEAVEDICRREELSVDELCAELKRRLDEQVRRQRITAEPAALALPKAMRVFIVGYFRQAATENGHDRAGHGRGMPFTRTPFEGGN